MSKEQQNKVSKGQIRDLNSRTVFKEPILCAQFLRDYTGIPLLKDVQPDDIEDVSEKYQAYLGISFETDTVTKVRIRGQAEGTPLFLVSLFEHKSQVDYNVTMQLLRYMICIWTEYAKEMLRSGAGKSANKNFKYPPILPIVYYEGAAEWTVDLHLKDRIMLSEVFGDYIPDFTYKLVSNRDYSNEELLNHKDEMSLLMMINKVQTPEDMEAFLNSQRDKIQEIVQKAPQHIVEIIASVIWNLCMKMNVPQEEAEQCVEKVRERRMGYWFENVKMDIQAERRKAEEACRAMEEGLAKARKEVEDAKEKANLEAQKRVEEEIVKITEEVKEKVTAEVTEKVTAEVTLKVIEEKYQAIISLAQEYNSSKEDAINKLVEKCNIDKQLAKEKLKLYWKE